jgi:serine O-acetyltransferase
MASPMTEAADRTDRLWNTLYDEVAEMAASEPSLASYLHATVLHHKTLEDSLSYLLAVKLGTPHLSALSLREVIDEALRSDSGIGDSVRRDLAAVLERDPAAGGVAQPFLYFKGFHALQSFRIAHWLWTGGRKSLALFLQNRISEVFGADIHPAARIGKGIMIDHGTSVVIGETAVVGNDVSMLHEVTLGGTGKERGDRHPKVGDGVMIGAGAKLLGNIKIGDGSKIAAGSVVLVEVPPHTTVAGVPARIVGRPATKAPALAMDQELGAVAPDEPDGSDPR